MAIQWRIRPGSWLLLLSHTKRRCTYQHRLHWYVSHQCRQRQARACRDGLQSTGTGLLLCFRSNGAASTLTVDGRTANPAERPNEDACRELGATTTLATDTLDFGSHTVSLAVHASGANQYQFYGGMIRTNIAVDRCTLSLSLPNDT